MTTQVQTTEAVFGQHLQALMSGNMDEILRDYTEESVIFSPQGIMRGLDQIQEFFTYALSVLTPQAMANLKIIRQDVDGEFAYVFWSAAPAVIVAGDTFCIRGGKIVMQSFAGYLPS